MSCQATYRNCSWTVGYAAVEDVLVLVLILVLVLSD